MGTPAAALSAMMLVMTSLAVETLLWATGMRGGVITGTAVACAALWGRLGRRCRVMIEDQLRIGLCTGPAKTESTSVPSLLWAKALDLKGAASSAVMQNRFQEWHTNITQVD